MPTESSKLNEAEIIGLVLEGNVNAFETLLRRYQDLAWAIVKRHVPANDVEDTVQNAFIRAFQSLPTYKGRGGGFKSWLSAITVRTCYDYWRNVYRLKEVPLSSITESHRKWLDQVIAEESEQALLEKGSSAEAREVLDWALARMSAEDRMVIELVYLEGLSGKEAAKLLGWSVTNVKVRAFRCRKKLEKTLQGLRKTPGEDG
ncbi:MAG: RNA polymerase sigma factor [Thermodesulfobacteriota bacterium]